MLLERGDKLVRVDAEVGTDRVEALRLVLHKGEGLVAVRQVQLTPCTSYETER